MAIIAVALISSLINAVSMASSPSPPLLRRHGLVSLVAAIAFSSPHVFVNAQTGFTLTGTGKCIAPNTGTTDAYRSFGAYEATAGATIAECTSYCTVSTPLSGLKFLVGVEFFTPSVGSKECLCLFDAGHNISPFPPAGVTTDFSGNTGTGAGVPTSADGTANYACYSYDDFNLDHSHSPSLNPSAKPSLAPSDKPSAKPSLRPSSAPSESLAPSKAPSDKPSLFPSSVPSTSSAPSDKPSLWPSSSPSDEPSLKPSLLPSSKPSAAPSDLPSLEPSSSPSDKPSLNPSALPSLKPSSSPSALPSIKPSASPSLKPSSTPSVLPSFKPSSSPSALPSVKPSASPSLKPSSTPSVLPSSTPSTSPSLKPSSTPSLKPSSSPSSQPSSEPSSEPSSSPSSEPSSEPSESPSSMPSESPSESPSAQPSESPSSNPSRSCENLRTDCGYGIFNPWTCQCDCPVGICLDSNMQCYVQCTDTIDINPFAGCAPGWDCPWFWDSTAGHCKSEMHQTETYIIYRTSKECCDANSGGDSCVQDSIDSHAPFPFPHYMVRPNAPPPEGSRKRKYFPDLSNKLNCVYSRRYEDWMMTDGYEDYYLFDQAGDCCSMWYPTRSDCPDTGSVVTPDAEDEAWFMNPYPMSNYYWPDFNANSCARGRDYPAWMADNNFEKHYLFVDSSECCSRYFPTSTNCPYETEDQTGYYWESYMKNLPNDAVLPPIINETYYPDLSANTCIKGEDYPDWMIQDDIYKRLYLYKDGEACCEFWFGHSSVPECSANIIESPAVNMTAFDNSTEAYLTMWYPIIEERRCSNDGATPTFMLADGFRKWYLFNTEAACCGTFDCSGI